MADAGALPSDLSSQDTIQPGYRVFSRGWGGSVRILKKGGGVWFEKGCTYNIKKLSKMGGWGGIENQELKTLETINTF